MLPDVSGVEFKDMLGVPQILVGDVKPEIGVLVGTRALNPLWIGIRSHAEGDDGTVMALPVVL